MTLSADDTRPESVRVADAIRAQVTSGELRPGDRVPSVRNLAAEFGVAEMTAQKAVEILRAEELITTRPGKGSFVRDRSTEQVPEQEHSSEFTTIMAELENVQSDLGSIKARMDKLEALVRKTEQVEP